MREENPFDSFLFLQLLHAYRNAESPPMLRFAREAIVEFCQDEVKKAVARAPKEPPPDEVA